MNASGTCHCFQKGRVLTSCPAVREAQQEGVVDPRDPQSVEEDMVWPVSVLTLRLLLQSFGDGPVAFAPCLHAGFRASIGSPGFAACPQCPQKQRQSPETKQAHEYSPGREREDFR